MKLPVICLPFLVWGIFLFPAKTFAADADIIINEIGAYESSGNEWVEIYNKGTDPVDLAGWKFWENSTNHSITLVQGANTTLPAGSFAVIAQDAAAFLTNNTTFTGTVFDSSWTTLNESGEDVGLKDSGGIFIENFTYALASNFSLERRDPALIDYTSSNWVEHATGNTVGVQNSAYGTTAPPPGGGTATSSQKIVINEFLPDPSSGSEWVELYSADTVVVDLTGWKLFDNTGSTIASPTSTISGSGWFVVYLTSSRLNNGGDTITLKDASGNVIDSVIYGAGAAPVPAKGNTVARKIDGGDTNVDANDFAETTTPTPGLANSITAVVSGGASNTPAAPAAASNTAIGSTVTTSYYPHDVVINELLIQPGDGQEEFVELFNNTGSSISLENWSVEDGNEIRTSLNGTLLPRQFFVLERPGGSLNNTGDRIAVIDPSGREIDHVTYGSWDDGNTSDNASTASEPNSLSRKSDGQDTDNDQYDFVPTAVITEGKANVIKSLNDSSGAAVSLANSSVIINELLPNPAGVDSDKES